MKGWVFSCLALSLMGSLWAEEQQEDEAEIQIIHEDRVEDQMSPENNSSESYPISNSKKKKKKKAHFVGAKKTEEEATKKSSRIENEWVVSKTHPKQRKKKQEEEALIPEVELPPRPLAIAHAEAKDKRSYRELSERIDDLQSQVNFLSDEVGADRRLAILKAPNGLMYFSLEWLFWTPKEEGTEFAMTTQVEKPGFLFGAESQSVHFGWSSGVRGGIGVHLPEDHWDIGVQYTYFRPTQIQTASGFVIPLAFYQGASSEFEFVQQMTSDFSINFQIGDVVIGKPCPISERLLVRPFMGMRGAWIKQKNMLTLEKTIGVTPYLVTRQNLFKGVGGVFGCESNWQLGQGVSFLANVGASLLTGRFDLFHNQETPAKITVVHWQDHWKTLSPMVQYLTGIAWDRNFHRSQWHVGVALSFEGQYWWDQNQFPIFMDDILTSYTHAQGNLSFYGFDLSVRFDF